MLSFETLPQSLSQVWVLLAGLLVKLLLGLLAWQSVVAAEAHVPADWIPIETKVMLAHPPLAPYLSGYPLPEVESACVGQQAAVDSSAGLVASVGETNPPLHSDSLEISSHAHQHNDQLVQVKTLPQVILVQKMGMNKGKGDLIVVWVHDVLGSSSR